MQDKTYYVVRNSRGKFVRAFINEEQAQRWIADEKGWTYKIEEPHAPDQDGNVFDLVARVEA